MSRYTGPVFRKARRLGFSITETGKELAKKPFIPGMHGQKRQRKLSNYGIQLQEKQKVKFMYGLSEKQFRKTFDLAKRLKGVHGDDFLKLLESRLDNVAYRLGFANSRKGARQIVNHGHITVNGKKIDIPSYRVMPGDVVAVKENSKNHKSILEAIEARQNRVDFVTYDAKNMSGTYVRMPERNELNADVNMSLIVEFYNR